MKTKIEIDVSPIGIQASAEVMIGDENVFIPLEKLSTEAIDALARQWLEEFYGFAKRKNPFTQRSPSER